MINKNKLEEMRDDILNIENILSLKKKRYVNTIFEESNKSIHEIINKYQYSSSIIADTTGDDIKLNLRTEDNEYLLSFKFDIHTDTMFNLFNSKNYKKITKEEYDDLPDYAKMIWNNNYYGILHIDIIYEDLYSEEISIREIIATHTVLPLL